MNTVVEYHIGIVPWTRIIHPFTKDTNKLSLIIWIVSEEEGPVVEIFCSVLDADYVGGVI